MNYEEALEYIHDVSWRGSKKGLSRTRELLRLLGNPHKELKFVHIAGTNGKGSTSACIESILRCAGYKTGLYTSPYITRFNERMQVNGRPIEDGELAELTTYVKPFAESMAEHPTEFELITALAMKYFNDNACDIVVLEVGLGGELDSTNVIDPPELAVITAMGYDHMQQLGNDMKSIASAKAGIIKPGTEVVIYGQNEEADAVFEKTCSELGVPLHKTDYSTLNVKKYTLTGTVMDYKGYKDIKLALAGTFQPYNAAVSITAAEVLREKGWHITDDDIYKGLETVRWPGRFELVRRDPVFMIDGAHNTHGIAAMSTCIKTMFKGVKPVFLVGVMADKDVSHMTAMIAELAKCVIAVRPDNTRSMEAEALAACFRSAGVCAESRGSISEGVAAAIEAAGRDGVVIALGSLYFSSDVRLAVKEMENA